MLSVIVLSVTYGECHYAECHYAECHYAECHYAEHHYTFCISVTFEMRTSEYVQICISIAIKTVAEQAFKQNGKMGKESKVA